MNRYSCVDYKAVFFLLLFSLSVCFAFAQSGGNNAASAVKDEADFVIRESNVQSAEREFSTNSQQTSNQQGSNLSGESNLNIQVLPETSQTSILFRIVISLALISFLAYIAVKMMRKASFFKMNDDPYLKDAAVLNLAVNKSIHVITLGSKAYLIGVTDSAINKLGEVEDKDLVDAMNLNASRNADMPKKDFASILEAFLPFAVKRAKENAGGFNSDFLDAQQERLKNIKISEEENKDGGSARGADIGEAE